MSLVIDAWRLVNRSLANITLKRIGRGAALLVGAALAYIGWTAWAIWRFPAYGAARCDAAVVLGAAARNGEPTPIFRERIAHGIHLYRGGWVRKLIFTGGQGEDQPLSLAEVAARVAERAGVPAADILLESDSRTTRENLAYTQTLARRHDLRTFLIVSDPLHLRRAMRMAADIGLDARPSATPTTAMVSTRERLLFLKNETYLYLQYVLLTRFRPVRAPVAAGYSLP